MSTLNNKVAIVTGASSGIGYATALLFAQERAKVVVSARRQVELRRWSQGSKPPEVKPLLSRVT
jgi:NAD(P)-dependent dehydrogenase (short-subunit alcohol dehydrogenase family)